MVPGKTVLVEGFLGVGWSSPTMPDERHDIQTLRPFSGPSHRQELWSVPAAMGWGWGGFRSPLEPGVPLLEVQWCVCGVVQEKESGSSTQLHGAGKMGWGQQRPLSSLQEKEARDLQEGTHTVPIP